MSMLGRVLLGLAMTAAPAAAQTIPTAPTTAPIPIEPDSVRLDIGVGYMFIYDITGGTHLPKGWLADVAFHGDSNASLVAEFKGTYINGGALHDALGGLRIASTGEKSQYFIEVTAGFSFATGGGGHAIVVQPGVGYDLRCDRTVGLRAHLDFVMNRAGGKWDKQVLVTVGLVFRRK